MREIVRLFREPKTASRNIVFNIIGWLVVIQTGVIISPLRRETRAGLEIIALRRSDPDRDLHILAEWLRRSDPDRDLHTYYFPAPSQFSDFPLLQ